MVRGGGLCPVPISLMILALMRLCCPCLDILLWGSWTPWPAKGVCQWGELHYRTQVECGGSDSTIKGLVFLGEPSLITIIPLQ